MKRVLHAIFFAFAAALLVFTFYGDELYAIGKPVAAVRRPSSVENLYTGERWNCFDARALVVIDGRHYVYVAEREKGFSRDIFTAWLTEIKVVRIEYEGEAGKAFVEHRSINIKEGVAVPIKGDLSEGARFVAGK